MSAAEREPQSASQIRTVTIRVPGVLALLLAVPALLLFGVLALAGLLAGVTALMLTPWLMRRQPRVHDEDAEVQEQTTITLDRAAYRGAESAAAGDARRLLSGPADPSRDSSRNS